ncbi:alpha/beta hydrolase [Isosphaeraceae bacterium EP7]
MDLGLARLRANGRFRRLLIVGILGLTCWMLASFGVAYRLTRRPRPPFAEPPPIVGWGLLEPHRLKTVDGQEVGAWYAAGTDDEAPSVLVLHGNGGSRRNCLGRAEVPASAGCSVLLISLRSHGDSTGQSNTFGLGARHDVTAAVDFLERRRPGKPVVVVGVSLGAAAAIFAAEELGGRVRGYLLESPFQDLVTAVRNRTRAYLPPVLDLIAYLGLRATAPLVLPEFADISPIRAIGRSPAGVPILILAAGADRLALPAEAIALHDRVRRHSRLVIIQGAGHHQILEVAPQRYRTAVLDFCARVGRGETPDQILGIRPNLY